jgi:hypothetical protein
MPCTTTHELVSLIDVSGCEVRFLNKEQGVLAVYVFRVEVRGVAEGEDAINKRKTGPKFRPCADYNQFPIGVSFLDNLGHSRRCDVLTQATLNLKDTVFFVSH